MKRCPECDFIYLDSDSTCDLDGNVLVPVDDPPDETTGSGTMKRTEGWKWLTLVAVIGTAFGVVIFVVHHRMTRSALKAEDNNASAVVMAIPSPVNSPSSLEASPTPEPTPTAGPKLTPSPRIPSTKLSSNPVSTTSDQNSSRGVTIRLTDGGTIAADEAWSTKEGIWFRRNGVVTLLKRNRVSAIERNR